MWGTAAEEKREKPVTRRWKRVTPECPPELGTLRWLWRPPTVLFQSLGGTVERASHQTGPGWTGEAGERKDGVKRMREVSERILRSMDDFSRRLGVGKRNQKGGNKLEENGGDEEYSEE